eukprot:m.73368 g.73368  ORF g.73368 m.73368 type:complete len:166 (-) comp14340_c0_seq2:59-556(-)
MATSIRNAAQEDVPALMGFVRELAAYEKESDQVQMTEERLLEDGFGPTPRYHCLIAELDGTAVGFALYVFMYSTWTGTSLYLEDLFVQEHARGKGLGVGLMRRLAQIAMENNCSRFQWQVIDWNSSSIDFYKQKLGARERVEQGDAKWLNYIVDGPALAKLAAAE